MNITVSDKEYATFYIKPETKFILNLILVGKGDVFLRDSFLQFYSYITTSPKARTQKTMTLKFKVPNSEITLQLSTRIYDMNSVRLISMIDSRILGIPKKQNKCLSKYLNASLREVMEETLLA